MRQLKAKIIAGTFLFTEKKKNFCIYKKNE